jgi:hypothetical protein
MDTEQNEILHKQTDFTNNGKTYRYDFNILTVEQVELAREVGEFKYNQSQNEPSGFRQVVDSGGAKWLIIAMSYLLRQIDAKGAILPFNKTKAETDTEEFVRNLPVSQWNELRGCASDFFTAIGKNQIASQMLVGEPKKSAIEMLLPALRMIMQGKSNATDS